MSDTTPSGDARAMDPIEIVDGDSLKTNRYDKVSSAIVAANVVLAFAVTLMLGIWLVRISAPIIRESFFPVPTAGLASGGEASERRRELATPELQELGMTTISVESMVQQVAVMAPHVVDRHDGHADGTGALGHPPGTPTDKRDPGPPEAVEPWDRWQIQWNVSRLDDYARQLDYFHIELGCAGGKPLMDYADNLLTDAPRVRTGRGSDEKRIYMTWRHGELLAADRKLLANAGIPTEGRVVLQFLSGELCGQLTELETRYAQSRSHTLIDVLRTDFAVRQRNADYEFYVVKQTYRTTEL